MLRPISAASCRAVTCGAPRVLTTASSCMWNTSDGTTTFRAQATCGTLHAASRPRRRVPRAAHCAGVPQRKAHVRERASRGGWKDSPRGTNSEPAVIRRGRHMDLHSEAHNYRSAGSRARVVALQRRCGSRSDHALRAWRRVMRRRAQSARGRQEGGSRTSMPIVRRTRSLKRTLSAHPPTRTSERFGAPSEGSGRSTCNNQRQSLSLLWRLSARVGTAL